VKFLLTVLLALLSAYPAVHAQEISLSTGPLIVQSSEGRQVWVNTATGIDHYPGTRWYGNTKEGKFMTEAEARAQGYRPARNEQ
jgi:hypothetical protein